MSDDGCKVTHWADGEGEIINYFGMMAIFKVRSHQTAGAFAVMEVDMPGKSGPPKMHIHPTSETFRVLSGQFDFQFVRDGETVTVQAGPGAIVHIPGGEPHLFRNTGAGVGKVEVIMCPGEMEGYFLTLGTPVDAPFEVASQGAPPDVQKLIAVGKQYGVEFLGS